MKFKVLLMAVIGLLVLSGAAIAGKGSTVNDQPGDNSGGGPHGDLIQVRYNGTTKLPARPNRCSLRKKACKGAFIVTQDGEITLDNRYRILINVIGGKKFIIAPEKSSSSRRLGIGHAVFKRRKNGNPGKRLGPAKWKLLDDFRVRFLFNMGLMAPRDQGKTKDRSCPTAMQAMRRGNRAPGMRWRAQLGVVGLGETDRAPNGNSFCYQKITWT